MKQLPETLQFADWNSGRSFTQQFELLDGEAHGVGIRIDIDPEDIDLNNEGECIQNLARDRARRVVASWNACRGISTETLENGVVKELVAACRGLLAQHDLSFEGREEMREQYYAAHPLREAAYKRARAAVSKAMEQD